MKRSPIRLNTKKKLMLLGGVAFSLGLVASITTTYAWYSVLESAYVGELNVLIETDYRLEMGTKQADGSIDYQNEYSYGDDERINLSPVSGMYESAWRNAGKNTPTFRSAYASPNVPTQTKDADMDTYIQHEYYLLSSDDCAVMLDSTSGFFPDLEANQKVAQDEMRDVTDLNNIKDTTRVSFYVDNTYHILKNENVNTYYSGRLDLNNDGYFDYERVVIDDKEVLREVLYGEYYGTPKYLDAYSHEEAEEHYIDYGDNKKNVFLGNSMEGVLRVDPSSVTMVKEKAEPIEEYMFDEDRVGERVKPLFYLSANTPKRVVISIYIEGWDLKTTDLLIKASESVKISFTPLYDYPVII